jgi:hypothetical protein
MKRLRYMFRYFLLPACALGLTLVAGAIHGRLSHRWSPPVKLTRATEQLAGIPGEIGPWRVTKEETLPEPAIEMLQFPGYINRTYAHEQTGERVAAAILLGNPGAIWSHTPQGCYPEEKYTLLGPARRIAVRSGDGEDDAFWLVRFRAAETSDAHLHVAFGWSNGGPWGAPDSPRWTFGGSSYLYKLQVAAFAPAREEPDEREICTEFLKAFVPAARRHLLEADSVWSEATPFPTASPHRTYSADWRIAQAMTRYSRRRLVKGALGALDEHGVRAETALGD